MLDDNYDKAMNYNLVPKDWKPFCFDEHIPADAEFCPGVHQTTWMGYIQPELQENCIKCPYRKKDD